MRYEPTPETLAIVQRLGGVWSSGHAMVRCPVHEDRTPSLSIRQGRATLLVHCFAGCDGADVVRAIRRVLGRPISRKPGVPESLNSRAVPFLHLWNEARPVEGTLGERYLREVRGIDFIPPDVRFHTRCPMGRGRTTRFLPALLVGVFRRERAVAIQRLFLDPETAARTHRMMLGNSRGGTWPAHFAGTSMTIAEGFETACAYRQLTGLEAGTCFGIRNFAHFELAAGTNAIILLPDNDPEGRGFADRAVAIRRKTGAPASVTLCPSQYDDWAEIIRPFLTSR